MRGARLVVAAPAHDGRARMLVVEFVRPLPDVADQILHPERAGPCGMQTHIGRRRQRAAAEHGRCSLVAPRIAPRIQAAVRALRGVLPLPPVRQALARPGSVGARVFQRHPGDRLVLPAGLRRTVAPVAEEVQRIAWRITGGVDERLELRVRHRMAVDVEGRHLHAVAMVATRGRFPRELHIHAFPHLPFDLDALHDEQELARRDRHHALWCCGLRRGWCDRKQCLRQGFPLGGQGCQRRGGMRSHLRQERLQACFLNALAQRQQCAEAPALQRRLQDRLAVDHARLQRRAAPQVEVARAFHMRHGKLLATDHVLVTVDQRPQRATLAGEAAGKDAGLQRALVGAPVQADKQRRKPAVDRGDAAQRLGIARGQLVPQAPHVLPRVVAHAVEEDVLQVVIAVAAPAVLVVDHVARFQPLELRHRRHDFVRRLLAPALHVPDQVLLGADRGLGLHHHGMAQRIAGIEERARHTVVGVAVDAVRADRLDDLRDGLPVGLAFVAGAVVPRHGGEEHAHAAAVEVVDRAAKALQPARQAARQVELVAVVHPDVGVHAPQQHAVQAAEARFQIIKVAVDGVAARDGIVEVAVLHHHLRMHEVALRPLQFRPAVVGVVVADAGQVFAPPVLQLRNPVVGRGVGIDLPLADIGERPARRLARRGQIALGGDVRELVFGLHHVRRVVALGRCVGTGGNGGVHGWGS